MEQMGYCDFKEEFDQITQETMMERLKELGCTYSYERIVAELEKNWSEMKVAEWIVNTCEIDQNHPKYSEDFVIIAVELITQRFHTFSFEHYVIIENSLIDMMNEEFDDQVKLARFGDFYSRLFKLSKQFKIKNFNEILRVSIEDIDLMHVTFEYIETILELGRNGDEQAFIQVLEFVSKFKKYFSRSDSFTEYSMDIYEATVLVYLKRPQGEKMFLKLLDKYQMKDLTVASYIMAFTFNDPRKAQQILKRYKYLFDRVETETMLEELEEEIEKRLVH